MNLSALNWRWLLIYNIFLIAARREWSVRLRDTSSLRALNNCHTANFGLLQGWFLLFLLRDLWRISLLLSSSKSTCNKIESRFEEAFLRRWLMIHSSSNLILINHFVVYAELEFSTTFICILAYSRDVLLLDLFKALIRVVLRRVISQARSLNLWSSSVSRFSAIHGFKRVLFRCLSLLLWCRGLGRVGNRILLLHAQRANVGILRSACLRCLRLLLLWRHSKTGK